MADNTSFKGTVDSLFSGLDSFLSSKIVVGDAINMGNTVILPLIDVSFGIGAGSFASNDRGVDATGAGGMGAKLQPSAVLVVSEGNIKLVNIKNQDSITKILDMLPDFVDNVTKNMSRKKGKAPVTDEEVTREASQELSDIINKSVNED